MPELPDITVYLEALDARVRGQLLERVRIVNPFVLRTAEPPIAEAEGKRVVAVRAHRASASCLALEDDLFLVIHLMIAGRLRWREAARSRRARIALAAFDFAQRHARAHRGGHEAARVAAPACAARPRSRRSIRAASRCSTRDVATFAARLATREPHAQARADRSAPLQRHRQRVLRRDPAPRAALAAQADAQARRRGDRAAVSRRRAQSSTSGPSGCASEAGDDFPEKVTAFRPEMAVHGKFGKPCPVCGAPVQRIVYAENECNYCARCQTGGKLLADRALSRLLPRSWPRTLDDAG